jgi:AraC-like DNA-binding protein
MNAMKGREKQWSPELPYMFRGGRSSHDDSESRRLWVLFSYIDQILAESTLFTEGLGLDEQICRLLAIGILRKEGHLEKIEQRRKANAGNWISPLDDLVNDIRSNAHLNLTQTDLEEQSNDSGRHLQNLFKEKFDCSPMHFARRQRLTTAME